jgi:hypothetical protein
MGDLIVAVVDEKSPTGRVVAEMPLTLPNLKGLAVSQIASLVYEDKKNWAGKHIHPTAAPYLDAMLDLQTVNDTYGADSGRGTCLYFVCNASQWHGPLAKAVKAELKARCK